nr:unnamed protein product [Spirometra erinaceieuropaei]
MNADKPKHDPPRSKSPYDLGGENDIGALNYSQQASINLTKVKTRKANEEYLRSHPEIGFMITAFMREAFETKPDNVREYAANFFTHPDLKRKMAKIQEDHENKMKICEIANTITSSTVDA